MQNKLYFSFRFSFFFHFSFYSVRVVACARPYSVLTCSTTCLDICVRFSHLQPRPRVQIRWENYEPSSAHYPCVHKTHSHVDNIIFVRQRLIHFTRTRTTRKHTAHICSAAFIVLMIFFPPKFIMYYAMPMKKSAFCTLPPPPSFSLSLSHRHTWKCLFATCMRQRAYS